MTLLIVPLIGYAALRSGYVQTWLTQKIASYLSKQLETTISVGGVDVTYFLDIVLKDVKVDDRKGRQIINSGEIRIDIDKIKSGKRYLQIGKAELRDATLKISKYKGDSTLNIQFIIDYFAPADTTAPSKPWEVNCTGLAFKNVSFSYNDYNAVPAEKGIDFNNLEISNLNLNVKDISLQGDTVCAKLESFSFEEKSGFILSKMNAKVELHNSTITASDLLIESAFSHLVCDLSVDFDETGTESFFAGTRINAGFALSRLSMKDIAYFAPSLAGMGNELRFSGTIKGSLDNIRTKDFSLATGKRTFFNGNVTLMGLPNFEETFALLKVKEFFTTRADIESLKIPSGQGTLTSISIPKELESFSMLKIKGVFTGFFNDFVSTADFITDAGIIHTNLSVKNIKHKGTLQYKGQLSFSGLDVSKIASKDLPMGKITMSASLEGEGKSLANSYLKLKATIDSMDFRKYIYRDITINGEISDKSFSGDLAVEDKNINLDFRGMVDFNAAMPVFDFSCAINHLDLYALNLSEWDSVPDLQTTFDIRLKGNKLDTLEGELVAKNTVFTRGKNSYALPELTLKADIDENNQRSLQLRSDYVDADIKGQYFLSGLAGVFTNFIKQYLPSYGQQQGKGQGKPGVQQFSFNINLKNTDKISKLFIPALYTAPSTVIYGSYNTAGYSLDLHGKSDLLTISGRKLQGWYIDGSSNSDLLELKTGCKRIILSDTFGLDNFSLTSKTLNDSIYYRLLWDDREVDLRDMGDIAGNVSFNRKSGFEMKFKKSKVIVNDSVWTVNPDASIISDHSSIIFSNLRLSSQQQGIMVHGIISDAPNTKLGLSFDNFNLSNLDFITNERRFDLSGILTGSIDLYDLYKKPNFVADISIKEFAFNNSGLGNIILHSNWDDENNGVFTALEIIYVGAVGESRPLLAKGYYYPDKKENQLDIDIHLENFRLKTIERYLAAVTSNFNGLASGDLRLGGALAKPELTGKVKLLRTQLQADYLNTSYTFADEITLGRDYIAFDNMILNDMYGNKALCNSRIYHKNFNKFRLDLTFQLDKVLCLNTAPADNSLFYGRTFMSGLVKVHGPVNDIVMDIAVKTEKGTAVSIPVTSAIEISETNYITFISKDTVLKVVPVETPNLSGIRMNFTLEATPDAEMQIIFDEKIGDKIKGTGSGNLNLEIDSRGDFMMYGDYTIEEGEYLFTLQNVINKRFKIEKGGTIKWNGDPNGAIVDLKAIYSLKASLYDLVLDSSSVYKKRIPVECVISLKDKLFTPTLSPGINLPETDENTRNLVSSIINAEQEVNRQFISLLVLRRFMPPPEKQYNNLAVVGSSSTELISNQLSNWLSQISNDFDIDLSYTGGDKVSNRELEVALSTQLFNDRVIIDGSVAVSGNQNTEQQRTSDIVGDVNVDVKLTEDGQVRAKVFNRSNYQDLLKITSPYTQGLGIFYHKEFDSFKDFFRRAKKETVVPLNQ